MRHPLPPPARGLYRHYKGGLYVVVGAGPDADDPQTWWVWYRNVNDGKTWTRRLTEWRRPTEDGRVRYEYLAPWSHLQ
jgi:hypothetical protein